MGEPTGVFVSGVLAFLAGLFQTVAPALVQVVLQRLAHVVMYAHGGVGPLQLFTLGHHRENAAWHHRGASVDGNILLQEYFGEILCQTPAYAVVLAFAHGGQVAQALHRGGVEALHLLQYIGPLAGELALLAGLDQGVDYVGIVVGAEQPARAVAPVMS